MRPANWTALPHTFKQLGLKRCFYLSGRVIHHPKWMGYSGNRSLTSPVHKLVTCDCVASSSLEVRSQKPTKIRFIHSGYFYSASSSPLLLRGASNTARILCQSFKPKRHRLL